MRDNCIDYRDLFQSLDKAITDAKEGKRAFQEKRKPVWKGR